MFKKRVIHRPSTYLFKFERDKTESSKDGTTLIYGHKKSIPTSYGRAAMHHNPPSTYSTSTNNVAYGGNTHDSHAPTTKSVTELIRTIKSAPPINDETAPVPSPPILMVNGQALTQEMIDALTFSESDSSEEKEPIKPVHKYEREKEIKILHKVLESKERVPIKITKESVLCREYIRTTTDTRVSVDTAGTIEHSTAKTLEQSSIVDVHKEVDTHSGLDVRDQQCNNVLDVIECGSRLTDIDNNSKVTEFSSSSDEIAEEDNLYVYVPVEKKKDKNIVKYSIEEILTAEPQTIFINFDKNLLKKRESIAEKFRLEMNRIAWSNADEVIKSVKYLKVSKQEIKIMAEILFEKAIQEETFSILYVYFLKNMKDFFYQGEMREKEEEWNQRIMQTVNFEKDNKYLIQKEDPSLNRSFFFNYFMILCQNFLSTKREWKVSKYEIDKSLSFEEQSIKSERFEELEYERNKIKIKEIGMVRIICIMFVNEVVSKKIMVKMIKEISKHSESEIESGESGSVHDSASVHNSGSVHNALNDAIVNGVSNDVANGILNDAANDALRAEDIELLCFIVMHCSFELFNALPKYFNLIFSEFERLQKIMKEKRTKFMLLDCIDEMKLIKNGKVKKSEFLDARICESRKEFKKYVAKEDNVSTSNNYTAPASNNYTAPTSNNYTAPASSADFYTPPNLRKNKSKSNFQYIEYGSDKVIQNNRNRSKKVTRRFESENEPVIIKSISKKEDKPIEEQKCVDDKVGVKCLEPKGVEPKSLEPKSLEVKSVEPKNDTVQASAANVIDAANNEYYRAKDDFVYQRNIVEEFEMYDKEELEMLVDEVKKKIENNEMKIHAFLFGFIFHAIQKKEVSKNILTFLDHFTCINTVFIEELGNVLDALNFAVEELKIDIPKIKKNFEMVVVYLRSKAFIKKEKYEKMEISMEEKMKWSKMFAENDVGLERVFGDIEEYNKRK